MLFSAYQIESMLEDFHKNILKLEKSSSDKLTISEDAINEAQQFYKISKDIPLDNTKYGSLLDLVEDRTLCDPIIDYVQQERAGRFVVPIYVPKNHPPKFPLVRDFDISKNENTKNKLPIENNSQNEINNDNHIEDKELIDSISHNPFESANDPNLFSQIDKEDLNEELVFSREKNKQINDDNDIVFGEGPILKNSISKFIKEYPESVIKFLLRKNLDGRPLPIAYEEIYKKWETRGLTKGQLKKYLFKLMKWKEFPDLPVLELLNQIRENLFDSRKEKV